MTSFAVRHISSNPPTSAGRLPSNMARIFNIQRYSLNDGGGIRTVVFSKAARTPARGAQTLNLFLTKYTSYAAKPSACIASRV